MSSRGLMMVSVRLLSTKMWPSYMRIQMFCDPSATMSMILLCSRGMPLAFPVS